MKKRIHLKKKRKFSIFWIIIIITIILFIISIASNKIKKSSQDYANHEIKKIISGIINETIKENSVKENIFKIEKEDEKITSIDIDAEKINYILANINQNIQTKMDSMQNTIVFKMPLFAPLNNVFLSTKGPKIPIKFLVLGAVLSNIRTELENYGINNALIKIYIDTEISTKVILPINSENVTINQTNILAIKIIQGNIPNYYLPIKN